MAISALKVQNLDGVTPVDIPITKLPENKLKVEEDGTRLVWSTLTEDPKFPNANLFEVSWTDEKGDNKVRGSSSRCEYANGTFTASELTVVYGFGLNFNGKMKIKDPDTGDDDPVSAEISVRIGNMGEGTRGQWVIDLSDKQGGAAGSSLNVGALIAWSKKNAGAGQPELPPMEETQKQKLNNLIIDFKEFHFNITKKTFDIDVRSRPGSKLQIGSFIIEEVALQLTNEPPKKPKKPEEAGENGVISKLNVPENAKKLTAG